MAEEDKEGFDEFAERSAQPVNFGRQDHLRVASEHKAAREAETQRTRGKTLSSQAQTQLLEKLEKKRASWQDDGLGIRGPVQQVSNATANLNWPSSAVTRRADPHIDQGDHFVEAEVPTAPT
jgi:hypothetical protein